MRINLDKVPLREKGMTAYEIMLSESQERMLCVVKQGFEEKVKNVFEKWDLHCEIIGEVTSDGLLHINYQGEEKAVIPSFELVLGGGAPVYTRESAEPSYLIETRKFDFTKLPQPKDITGAFKKIFSSPNIVSKKWVYEQYDSTVRTNTIVGPGCDAAVVHIKDTDKALAMKTDCNSRYVYLNPKVGTKIAVAESARNIVCSGGIPLAITNCLNFGNPYKPENYWQFSQAIEGMGEACRFFKTPVTGGNVSFYNESPNAAVYPTPTIGMVGLVEKLINVTTSFFKSQGDLIYVLGEDFEELGGSEYLKIIHGKVAGDCPHIDLQVELNLHETILTLIEIRLIESAHDVSEGGIICALAECSIMNEENLIGAEVNIPIKTREDFSLFSESQSRVIVSVKEKSKKEFESILIKKKQHHTLLGRTIAGKFNVNDTIKLELIELSEIYYNTIPQIMNG
jgi:phosphoribosylformylglycinamidine synthase